MTVLGGKVKDDALPGEKSGKKWMYIKEEFYERLIGDIYKYTEIRISKTRVESG